MAERFMKEVLTPEALEAQLGRYGRAFAPPTAEATDRLGPDETEFIARRDSFYMASVTSTGWPYVQHRGGPPGFLKVLDPRTLAFADLRGNRQLVSTGNLSSSDKVALILVDYPHRERMKILGHATVLDARVHPDLLDAVVPEALRSRAESIVRIDVVGFDWNCPAYITPRYTEDEIDAIVAPLQRRIAELEAAR